MEWNAENVKLLGRNLTQFVDGGIRCAAQPAEADLVAFRAAPEHLTALMEWLSIGDYSDAVILNAFVLAEESLGQDEVEDKATAHTVKIDWARHNLSLVKENPFDEHTMRMKQVDGKTSVWMVRERRRGDPSDQITTVWIVDWEQKRLYRQSSTAAEAEQGGAMDKVAELIAKMGSTETALDWAKARSLYDEVRWSSPFAFNPLA